MKRKIVVTTGTRAEYGILRPLLHEIVSSKKLDLYLIVTGTHLSKKHGFTIDEIKKDGFKIYKTINIVPKGDSTFFMAESLGKAIVEFARVFSRLKPDINVVLGDRDEMLASALAASHMNIPNAHIHGGEKSGGIDEYNRHAITKLSNIHFAVTKKSMERIIKMGENPKYVFFTGSPSIDEVINGNITTKAILEKKYKLQFNGKEVLLVQHPVTTEINKTEKHIDNILKAIVKSRFSTIAIAPNSDAGHRIIFKKLDSFSNKYKFISVYPNIPRSDYLGILQHCGVLIGNSSSGLIEAGYFNTPVINIGIRQQNRERGKNVFNINGKSVNSIYQMLVKSVRLKNNRKFSNLYLYGHGDTSKKIVKYLESITLNERLIQKQLSY